MKTLIRIIWTAIAVLTLVVFYSMCTVISQAQELPKDQPCGAYTKKLEDTLKLYEELVEGKNKELVLLAKRKDADIAAKNEELNIEKLLNHELSAKMRRCTKKYFFFRICRF